MHICMHVQYACMQSVYIQYVCMTVCTYVCIYVRTNVCMYVCMYVCTYKCVQVCTVCMYVRTYIRRHARDVYLGMCPVQNGVSYLNVLGRFSETSQTAVAKSN